MRNRRRWLHLSHDHGEPIWRSRYDIVAAIVVMSVGMCIWIGAPLATHAVVFDLPVSSGLGKPFEPWPDEVATHLLGVSPEGAILWDDEFIDQGELIDNLQQVAQSSPRHGLVFEPDARASYELVAQIMHILVASEVTQKRFCLAGLRQYADDLDESRMRQYLTTIYYPSEWELERVDRETMVGCEESFH